MSDKIHTEKISDEDKIIPQNPTPKLKKLHRDTSHRVAQHEMRLADALRRIAIMIHVISVQPRCKKTTYRFKAESRYRAAALVRTRRELTLIEQLMNDAAHGVPEDDAIFANAILAKNTPTHPNTGGAKGYEYAPYDPRRQAIVLAALKRQRQALSSVDRSLIKGEMSNALPDEEEIQHSGLQAWADELWMIIKELRSLRETAKGIVITERQEPDAGQRTGGRGSRIRGKVPRDIRWRMAFLKKELIDLQYHSPIIVDYDPELRMFDLDEVMKLS